MGKTASIPESEYDFWEKQARAAVDEATHGRIQSMTTLPECIQDCTCAVAETMYEADTARKASTAAGASGPMTSYSNDGESGSFSQDSDSIVTVEGEKKRVAQIITRYLARTGLLYAAVPVVRW